MTQWQSLSIKKISQSIEYNILRQWKVDLSHVAIILLKSSYDLSFPKVIKAGFHHADFSASADFYAWADFSAYPHMNFDHNAGC